MYNYSVRKGRRPYYRRNPPVEVVNYSLEFCIWLHKNFNEILKDPIAFGQNWATKVKRNNAEMA